MKYSLNANKLVKILVGLLLLLFACIAAVSADGQINFNTVENQSLFYSNNQMQQKAQDYLNAHFPPGYPIDSAMAALTKAGATCSFATNEGNPNYYVCDYSRPDHGLAYFFINLDWLISLHFTPDHRYIMYISVIRGETGP